MNPLRDRVPAGQGTDRREYVRRFDGWAASYDRSPLHVPHPGMILDVGCGTGCLSARLASAYDQARVAGIDASTG